MRLLGGVGALMAEAASLLLLQADVQPKETLHMDLLWSWRQAAECLCSSR